MSSRKREYGFTLNNWTEESITHLTLEHTKALYIVYGKEIASTGTPHLQGYIYFPTLKSMAQVCALVPGISLQPVINKKQCILYCKKGSQSHEEWDKYHEKGPNYGKDADVTELGAKPEQGKRTDIDKYISAVEDGVRDPKRLRYEHSGVCAKYPKFADQILRDYIEIPSVIDVLDNEWIYGPARIGKSRSVRFHNPDLYLKNKSKWWDGYMNQHAVLIDEFSPYYSYMADDLKNWADHYEFTCEVKNGMITIRPRRIIVTSNYSIRECFPHPKDYEPLEARFKEIHMTEPFQIPEPQEMPSQEN
jgi:hypothetical protein